MPKDFYSGFDAFFSRKLGKENATEFTMGETGSPSEAAAAMDQIEQKIAQMEMRAEATRTLTKDANEREAQAFESKARVEDDLAALKRQAIDMRQAGAAAIAGEESTALSGSDRPNSALSKIRLVVGEPKKWLPALLQKKSNLPKRSED